MRRVSLLFHVVFISAALLSTALSLTSCGKGSEEKGRSIAVFIPGVLEGSPTYEMLDAGIREAAKPADITVKTVEGGFDQASWETQLTVLASEGKYGLIVSSNPAISEIAVRVGTHYPDQDFLILDGSGLVSGRVSEVVYRHSEQAFLSGYFAGMVTSHPQMNGINPELKVGLIAAQEYPQMNREILPGFEIGLHTVNPDIQLEFRVIGNWYDAEKAREIAESLYREDVDIILTIAGSANEGVITAARNAGKYVLWFDSEGSSLAPGVVLASSVVNQQEAAKRWCTQWIEGNFVPGESIKVGIREGFVNFPTDSRLFRRYVPYDITVAMTELANRMKSGKLNLDSLAR